MDVVAPSCEKEVVYLVSSDGELPPPRRRLAAEKAIPWMAARRTHRVSPGDSSTAARATREQMNSERPNQQFDCGSGTTRRRDQMKSERNLLRRGATLIKRGITSSKYAWRTKIGRSGLVGTRSDRRRRTKGRFLGDRASVS